MNSPCRLIAYVLDPNRLAAVVSHFKAPHVPRKGAASLDAPGKIPLDRADDLIAAFHRAQDSCHLFVELSFKNDLISHFHVQCARPFCLRLEDRGLFGQPFHRVANSCTLMP